MRRLISIALLLGSTLACDAITGSDVATPDKPKPGGAPVVPKPGDAPDGGEGGGIIGSDDCDKVKPDPLPKGEWISGKLTCGDEIVSHTEGTGRNLFDTRFYEKHFCWPATIKRDGANERVFVINVPEGDKTVNLTMESPCADLDMAAFKYSGKEPPTVSSNIGQCEMNSKDGTKTEKVRLTTQKATTWVVVVEGKEGEDGPFSLKVACKDGLY